jgi:2-methylisocitrate lyase-like PEP mutase family enzyme
VATSILREKLTRGEFILAPGVFDMMSSLMAKKAGFDIIYGSGYWMMASHLGLPDVGIATYRDFEERLRLVVERTGLAVIADADTGFGGLLNVDHTVKGYERIGVCAIQIEDQEFPKKCGHTPHKIVVPVEDMVARIKVACAARDSKDFLVIARTDARAGEGLDAALRRVEAYAKAGADLLFVEAPADEAEMRRICTNTPAPQIANMSESGLHPILSVDAMREIGYAGAIFPATAPLVALKAISDAYAGFAQLGRSTGEKYDFKTFCADIGFPDVWAFESKWGRY